MKLDAFADEILDFIYGTDITAVVGGYYLALLEAITDGDVGTWTEAGTDYAAYARQQLPAGTKDAYQGSRRIRNNTDITFPAKAEAGSKNFIGWALYDASTAGNAKLWGLIDPLPPLICLVNDSDLAGDTIQHENHGLANDQQCRIEQVPGFPGGLPTATGFAEDTDLWVVGVTTHTFQLSTTQGGGALDFTDSGGFKLMPFTPMVIQQNGIPKFSTNNFSLIER